jgi:hypothetical protein
VPPTTGSERTYPGKISGWPTLLTVPWRCSSAGPNTVQSALSTSACHGAEAVEVARKAGRAERMRIMDLDSGEKMPPWKMDLSPNRPNVVVRDGKVVSAALF